MPNTPEDLVASEAMSLTANQEGHHKRTHNTISVSTANFEVTCLNSCDCVKQPPFESKKDNSELYAIRILRILWTLWIFAYHYRWTVGDIQSFSGWTLFTLQGDFGVECFYALSGFILTMTNLNRFKFVTVRASAWQILKFVVIRLCRLYPLHMLSNLIFYFFRPQFCSTEQIVQELTLSLGWMNAPRGCNGPSWFIHFEVYMSIVLAVALVFINVHWLFLMPVFGMTFWFGGYYMEIAALIRYMTLEHMFVRAAALFLTGMLMGVGYMKWKQTHWVFDVTFGVSLCLIVQQFTEYQTRLPDNMLFKLGLACLTIYSAAKSIVFSYFANNPFFKMASELSFGIYIFQSIVLIAFDSPVWGIDRKTKVDHLIVFGLLNLAVTAVLAALAYCLIERPLRTFSINLFMAPKSSETRE